MLARFAVTLGPLLLLLPLSPSSLAAQGPKGWLVVAADSVPLLVLGSCWDSGEGMRCADTFRNFRSVEELDLESVEVGAGQTLSIVFEPLPSTVTLKPQGGFGMETALDPSAATFSAPSLPGSYDYKVGATWDRGDGNWVVRIRVAGQAMLEAGVPGASARACSWRNASGTSSGSRRTARGAAG